MRFPIVLKRYVDAVSGHAQVGSDGTLGTPPTATPSTALDNVLSIGPYSNQGWPAHRIGVGYKYTGAGPAVNLNAQVWIFEQSTGVWYLLESTKALVPNRIIFFDICTLIDSRFTNRDQSASAGAMDAYLMVEATAGPPNGTYEFGFFADLTTLAV